VGWFIRLGGGWDEVEERNNCCYEVGNQKVLARWRLVCVVPHGTKLKRGIPGGLVGSRSADKFLASYGVTRRKEKKKRRKREKMKVIRISIKVRVKVRIRIVSPMSLDTMLNLEAWVIREISSLSLVLIKINQVYFTNKPLWM